MATMGINNARVTANSKGKEPKSMGLDQYVYKISTPDESIETFMRNRLVTSLPNSMQAFCTDYTEELSLIKQLLPYGIQMSILTTTFDIDLFHKDHGIPEDAEMVGQAMHPGHDEYVYDNKHGYHKTFDVSEYLIEHRYTQIVKMPYLVVCMSDVMYWRNNREIQDAAYDALPVENCGYYVLDDAILDEFQRIDPTFEIPELGDNERLVYHEWY